MAAAQRNRVTLDEYLAYDLAHEGRHGWVNGEIVAMAGASEAHGIIVSNLGSLLRTALSGRPCRVFYTDLRVAIESTDPYTYSDITVTCGERKFLPTNPPTLVNPVLLVEVLSAGTAGYDRGAKAAHYRRCPSLKSLVLVDSKRRHVEVFDRDGDGWRLVEAGGSASIALACIDARIELDAIYDGTELVAKVVVSAGPSSALRAPSPASGRRQVDAGFTQGWHALRHSSLARAYSARGIAGSKGYGRYNGSPTHTIIQ